MTDQLPTPEDEKEREENLKFTAGILKQVYELYVGERKEGEELKQKPSTCLESIAANVGLEETLLHPLTKVSVMIIGNHSAGKSSFVNWYCEDEVQKTGMAIETQGFSFITSGFKASPPLKGETTLMRFPHIKPLKKKFGKGFMENLTTRVSVSRAKSFPLIDFIDTPGLVDGEVTYPMDVNECILELGAYADVIFVFMDPIGKALVSRTMDVVRSLNKIYYHKMKYYMTKADTIGSGEDLLKVVSQINQNIHPILQNQHGFEIPPIFLPNHREGLHQLPGRPKDINQISKLTDALEQAIQQKVQDNLNKVEEDCEKLSATIAKVLSDDVKARDSQNLRVNFGVVLYFLAWLIPVFTFLQVLVVIKSSLSKGQLEAEAVQAIYSVVEPLAAPFMSKEPEGLVARLKYFGMAAVMFLVLRFMGITLLSWSKQFKTKKDSELDVLREQAKVVKRVLGKREQLYQTYFQNFTKEHQYT